MDALGLPRLETPEQLVVEAQLKDVRGLGAARELGVEGLVRSVLPENEEVRNPAPATICEDALVHNVDAGFYRFASRFSSGLVPILSGDLANVEGLEIGRASC